MMKFPKFEVWFKRTMLIATIVVALNIVSCGPSTHFNYIVAVEDEKRIPINNATVRLELSDSLPLIANTDAEGVTLFSVGVNYINKPAIIRVILPGGFEPYVKSVAISRQKQMIQVRRDGVLPSATTPPIFTETVVSLASPTSTTSFTPTPTNTLVPTFTHTFTATLRPSATYTLAVQSLTPVFTPYPTSSDVICPDTKNQFGQIGVWKTDEVIFKLDISPSRDYVASAEQNGNVIVRNLVSGDIVRALKFGNFVRDVAFSVDGRWLAAAGSDGFIKVWNTAIWGDPIILSGHNGAISSLAFSPDGQWLASGGDDKSIRLWSVNNGWKAGNLIPSSKSVKVVVFSPDSRYIAVGSNDSVLRIWSQNGEQLYSLTHINGPKNGSIVALSFSPDGKYIISGTTDTNNSFQVWKFLPETPPGGVLEKRLPMDGQIFTGTDVKFSPDGSIFVTGTSNNYFMIWRTSNFSRILPMSDAHQDTITSIDFSPDGKLIITGSKDMTLRIWGIK
ncbi:MAG: WD40 repeat domain-containing protein [Anaerolineae bacterium]|nr:WD40 repeat domain-containing protein [Anaerolineae bacterium]